MQVAGSSEAQPNALEDGKLPQRPLVLIKATHDRYLPNLYAIWEHRELLYFLIWRDLKVRYKQTALGIIWVMLQPLLMMLVFTLFFGRLAGIRSGSGVPYALFAYAGLLPWTFFATAVNTGSNSLVGGAHLISKVYFPRLLIPLGSIGAVCLDLVISLSLLAVLMIYWRVVPTWSIITLPIFLILLIVLTLGFGIFTAALNVKYRDVRVALPFLLQVWFFCSPIIYPISMVPPNWRWVMLLNPMTGIVGGTRVALYGGEAFDWLSISISAGIAFLVLVWALFTFKRMETSFADVI